MFWITNNTPILQFTFQKIPKWRPCITEFNKIKSYLLFFGFYMVQTYTTRPRAGSNELNYNINNHNKRITRLDVEKNE